jgi:hypothetical protein
LSALRRDPPVQILRRTAHPDSIWREIAAGPDRQTIVLQRLRREAFDRAPGRRSGRSISARSDSGTPWSARAGDW